jgi:acid stress-induced BolA-like protein IbaG/YrbA
MTEQDLKQRIESGLTGAQVQVFDTKGTGDHFSAVVIFDEFEGKSLVKRHQMVYATVSDVLTKELHALQLKTYSHKEWKQEN